MGTGTGAGALFVFLKPFWSQFVLPTETKDPSPLVPVRSPGTKGGSFVSHH
jgi:hypothetical protein